MLRGRAGLSPGSRSARPCPGPTPGHPLSPRGSRASDCAPRPRCGLLVLLRDFYCVFLEGAPSTEGLFHIDCRFSTGESPAQDLSPCCDGSAPASQPAPRCVYALGTEFSPAFLLCNHRLTDLRSQPNWARPACHHPLPDLLQVYNRRDLFPPPGRKAAKSNNYLSSLRWAQASQPPVKVPTSARPAGTCPVHLGPQRPQATTFHPDPPPAGDLSPPKPTPYPTGGARAELSAATHPPLRGHPDREVDAAKEGREVGYRHVWAGDLWGLCRDKASDARRQQDGRPGPRAPGSRGGAGSELPGLQTPRGTLEARGSAVQPQGTCPVA